MKNYLIIVVLLIAAAFRFWNLGNVPPSASLDEASIGYNAYSVLKIGVDEYGSFPIISQRGYDDWRRSTYLFLTIPFIALLNLQVVAVRLPAVILSLLTILAFYRISSLLFLKKTNVTREVALVAIILLAINPWHVYISRLGHESNAYLSFFIFGLLFFLEGIKDKKKLLFAVLFFTLSMISYYAGQVLIPLFLIGIGVIYRKMILADKKILMTLPFVIIALIPILWAIFSPSSLLRFQGTSTFKPDAHYQEVTQMEKLRIIAKENHDIINTIRYSRRLFPIRVFIGGYISHFSPTWLFTNSSNEPFKVPRMGLLYAWQIPFIIMGIVFFLYSRAVDPRVKKLVLLWLFLAPLPGAVATGAPHAMRAYALVPIFQIFTAFGLVYVWNTMRNYKTLGLVAFGGMMLVNLLALYNNYFIVFPKEQSDSFQYALAKVIPYVVSQEEQYQKVVFSNEHSLYQSYMFFLYYTRYSPILYQRQGGTKSGGFAEAHAFGKYEFRPIDWKNEKSNNALYVGNTSDFPNEVPALATFSLLDGKKVIKAVSL